MNLRHTSPLPDPDALERRRRKAIAVLILLVLAAPLAASAVVPQIVASARIFGNDQLGWFAEERFRQLVFDGAMRPAKPAEVDLWLRQAIAAGNNEIEEYRSALIAQSFVALQPVDLPNGMFGAHSRVFLVPEGGPVPHDRDTSHNTLLFLGSGTCVGSYPGCASL